MNRALATSAFARPRPVDRRAPPLDQATGLRHLLGGASPQLPSFVKAQRHLRVLAVTGSAAPTRHDLFDLLSGRLDFDAVAVSSGNWRLLPAQRGLRKLAEAGTKEEELLCAFLRLHDPVSLLLVNLDDQAHAPLPVGASGGEVLLVTAPGQAAITAAYARIKALGRDAARRSDGLPCTPATIRVLVNGASHYADARRVFRVLADTARNFLDVEPVYAGFLPPDRGGMPFGTNRHVPAPACAAALARLTTAARSWHLAEYKLPDTGGVE